MKMVVVGGNSRDIGKTSVVAGIIRALPHRDWLAIKLTQFGTGGKSSEAREHGHTANDSAFAIREEQDRSGETDTSRFLLAGAQRALWITAPAGTLDAAMAELRREIERARNVIVESNSILRFYEPNVYMTLLDPSTKDFKASAREFLERADALLVLGSQLKTVVETGPQSGEDPRREKRSPWLPGLLTTSPWDGVSLDVLRRKPVFPVGPEHWVAPEIVDFVEARLRKAPFARYLSS